MSFAVDIEKFAKKARARSDALVRKVVLDCGTSVVFKSPVGDPKFWKVKKAPPGYVGGRFRANWQYGDGSIPSGTIAAVDPSGAATINNLSVGIPSEAAGKVHYLINRLPYGPRLENGWSRQAPYGMVHLTVIEFQAIVNAATASIKEIIK